MRIGLVLSFFLSCCAISAGTGTSSSRFVVEIGAKDVGERSMIASLIHPDSVVGDRVFAVVNGDELAMLSNSEAIDLIGAELLEEDRALDRYYQPFMSVVDFPDADAAFHTYDEMLLVLQGLASDFSALVELFSIGKTVQNRDIWAIRISDDSEPRLNKKGMVYMATHHAREHVSTEMPIMFAKELLNSSLTDPGIQQLLKQIEIYIIPMVNPDGVIHDITGKRYKYWRKNRRTNSDGSVGVDLNRNYGFGWGTGGSSSTPTSEIYMGTGPFSEPETASVRDFF
ncbi:MAG TPA: M14 family zinc carboxypeptidase, partial [Myxococcota bacterium]|nr:M14 family zinc carboxypeptidase [Myxococcota bacterium]